jgi:hypothetical protein
MRRGTVAYMSVADDSSPLSDPLLDYLHQLVVLLCAPIIIAASLAKITNSVTEQKNMIRAPLGNERSYLYTKPSFFSDSAIPDGQVIP